jgi:ribulose-5-phosphate 4-epimerase/fuculose-1-phosphate aldolase
MELWPVAKLIGTVRRQRKDILLVGFKHTSGASPDEQYIVGLHLVKEASCNLVLANDTVSRRNMVVTPEEARYHVTTDRDEALRGLVEMAYLRSHLTFTRSTVVAGEPVPWDSLLVPDSLREVVNYCIRRGAYKPFRGSTAGHFAVKLDASTFLTSRRKTDFNNLGRVGLVKVVTDGPDSVIAYGSKPSVGGQSQRIVFHDHPDHDCIVHFHCPIKPGSEVPQVSQREYECGSHECGQNTSRGLRRFGNLSAVYLQEHGPNVVFHRSIDPQEVIHFIEDNFDLSEKTGGPTGQDK